jgi:hypothetical protein
MKLEHLFESENTSDSLKSLARSIGEKMYGNSHTGFVFSDKFSIMKLSDIESESEFVDTYDFVFFPSTKKGLEAADKYKLDDEKLRDKDGFLYLAGADGVKVVYFGKVKPKIKITKNEKLSQDEWKKQMSAKYSDVEFVRKIERTDAMVDNKVASFWFDDVKLAPEYFNPPKKLW